MVLQFLIYIFLIASAFSNLDAKNSLEEWNSFNKSGQADSVINFIRCSAYSELFAQSCKEILPETPSFFGHLGIFITIVNQGKVRGCFGAFRHKNTNLALVIKEYISGALKNDPRYPPLEREEFETAKFILTIAEFPIPVADNSIIALGRFGVYLTKEDGQSIVYVPGEIRSMSILKKIIIREKIQEINVFKAILIQ